MNLDSGADHTVVRADLITEADYTGGTSRVGDYYRVHNMTFELKIDY